LRSLASRAGQAIRPGRPAARTRENAGRHAGARAPGGRLPWPSGGAGPGCKGRFLNWSRFGYESVL